MGAFQILEIVSAVNPEAADHARVLPGSGGDAFDEPCDTLAPGGGSCVVAWLLKTCGGVRGDRTGARSSCMSISDPTPTARSGPWSCSTKTSGIQAMTVTEG